MQVGNIWLKLDSSGSNIQLENVTPAEVAILNENHEVNSKTKDSCHDLTNVRDEKRDNEVEINRLRAKYANAKDKKGNGLAETLYPGKNPTLPQTFKEVGLMPLGAPKVEEPKKPEATPPTK